VDHLDLLDLELDLTLWRDLGLMLGAGLIVYGQERDLVRAALNCLEFYRNESCGQCTPCRIGSEKLVQIGKNLVKNQYDAAEWGKQRQLIEKELAPTMRLTSICGLGTVAFAPMTSLLKYFPSEWRRYL
jgi:NADH:ubiquinone oxidoreductase subunit F (NADH-binding)